MSRIHSLLCRLGITRNYVGFYITACAVMLAMENEEHLLHVTKRLYPLIAARCSTTPRCVERNLRRMAELVWNTHPDVLRECAGCELHTQPTASAFIAILTDYLLRQRAANA